MNFLEIEGNVLLNMDLMDKIELLHNRKTAVLYVGTLVQADSGIAYQWLMQNRDSAILAAPAPEVAPVKA